MQSNTARMLLLTATRASALGRRCWSSPTVLSTLSPCLHMFTSNLTQIKDYFKYKLFPKTKCGSADNQTC